MLGWAAVLIPWTAFVVVTLPGHYVANLWEVACGGLAIGLGERWPSRPSLLPGGRRSRRSLPPSPARFLFAMPGLTS
jgi:hypothetical protein